MSDAATTLGPDDGADSAALQLALTCCATRPQIAARALQTASRAAAAELLARVEPEISARVVSAMSASPAGEVLEALPEAARREILLALRPGLAANAVRAAGADRQAALLACLTEEERAPVVTLLVHDPDSVGAAVDPRAVSVSIRSTVEDALAQLREAPEPAQDRLFVTDDAHQFVGAVSLHALLCAAPELPIERLVQRKPASLLATSPLSTTASHAGWVHTSLMPVTDRTGRFVGALPQSAITTDGQVAEHQAGAGSQPTFAALVELCGVSTLVMLRWVGAALGGRPGQRPS